MSKKDKIKERYAKRIEGDTIRIPPKAKYDRAKLEEKKLRVAAYCRVSTDNEEQTTSFEAQKQHYMESISKHENWELVSIYADEGISGTSTKHRDAFNQMITDAMAGNFDLIITKTVSRFTRNVVDGLTAARKLLAQNPPVGIYFEEDKFNTLMPNCEFILTIMLSLAQGESTKKSESMITSYEWRYNRNDYFCPTRFLLGYESNEDGNMVIEHEGAKTIRAIFTMYLAGMTASEIARVLTELGRPTGKNNHVWSGGSVMNIIRNERYCGDIIAQKTYTVSCLDHKVAKNRGQKWIHYMAGHHEGIVTREEYVRALLLSNTNQKSKYFNPGYELRVVHEGLLSGFIPINCAFGGYDAGHYLAACDVVPPLERNRKVEIVNIEGCELARVSEFNHFAPAITFSAKGFSISKECVSLFPNTEYVELLIHPKEHLLAIRKADATNKDAIRWKSGYVSSAAIMPVLYDLCGWYANWKFRALAVCLAKRKERILMFDLGETETIVYDNEFDAQGNITRRFSCAYLPPTWQDNFGQSMSGSFATCRRHLAESLGKWNTAAPALPVSGFENKVQTPDEESVRAAIKAMGA